MDEDRHKVRVHIAVVAAMAYGSGCYTILALLGIKALGIGPLVAALLGALHSWQWTKGLSK